MHDTYRFVILSLYAQIVLLDAQNSAAYPEWTTGDEKAVYTKNGIAVATAGDSNIEVIIKENRGVSDENLYPCLSAIITIGEKGLLVGNIPSGNVNSVPWMAGDVLVKVYTNQLVSSNVTIVVFTLSQI